MFANRVAVQVFDCSGQLCGRIVWLLRPRTPTGQPDLDNRNPEPALRQRHLCGLTIIWGLQPGAPGHWTDGWLYDPQDAAPKYWSVIRSSASTGGAKGRWPRLSSAVIPNASGA